ncbi:MAG: type 1 glutamine amidotransferase domain-containing protein [Elusimicrobiota bacterium]
MTKIIAAIVGDKFEDSEYTEPVNSFREEGHRVVNVGIKEGDTVRGKKKGTEVTIDEAVENASVDKYDALLIPGGKSPGNLRENKKVLEFVRDFVNSKKPVFSICHGPQLLISAGVIKGKVATGYKSIREEIENAGAQFRDEEVVTDGNLIFSRNPGDLPVFIETSLKKLQ